jgi:hypothetical protein
MITEFSTESAKTVQQWGDYLFYSSQASGFENIMAVEIETGEKYQISSRINGVVKPFVGVYGGKRVLLYGEYDTGETINLVQQELDQKKWIPWNDMQKKVFVYYGDKGHIEGPMGRNLSQINLESKNYTGEDIQDYSTARSKLNVHSWGVNAGGLFESLIQVSAQSTDVMSTMDISLGGEYYINEHSPGAFFSINWTQFYPNISWDNRYRHREIDNEMMHDISSAITLSFPLNLNQDIWSHTLKPYIGSSLKSQISPDEANFTNLSIPLFYGLNWSLTLPGSYRSLRPLFGFRENFYFEHNPIKDSNYFLSSSSTVFLPGGLNNTGLSLTGTYEQQTGDYSSRVIFSRGYKAEIMNTMYQIKGNYYFPIAYPDLALSSIAYIKRLRGNLFYDYTVLDNDSSEPESFKSVGAELLIDFTAFNLKILPLNLGIRYSWLIEQEEPMIQFILMDQ